LICEFGGLHFVQIKDRIFKKREKEVTLLPVKSRAKEIILDTRVNNQTNTNAENSESMVAKVISF